MALVNWREADEEASARFDRIFAEASARHPGVLFGEVDVDADPRLALNHEVLRGPTLMAFRDGILLFEREGGLPGALIDVLVEAMASLDMAAVRKGLDGGGTRLVLALREDDGLFDLVAEEGGGGGTPPLPS